jgi:hypothetical protein
MKYATEEKILSAIQKITGVLLVISMIYFAYQVYQQKEPTMRVTKKENGDFILEADTHEDMKFLIDTVLNPPLFKLDSSMEFKPLPGGGEDFNFGHHFIGDPSEPKGGAK